MLENSQRLILFCVERRELAAPRGDRKVVGLMPGLCAALCGFGLLSLRVPGFPPGSLAPAKDSHTRMIGSSVFFFSLRQHECEQAHVVCFPH